MEEEKNIPEENSNKEAVNENISQQESIEQNETTNQTSEIQKSEIENMEVHHHPHVEKKNFKEYLLEGLMIFLAVTMGFIAENIREAITDNKQENEYVRSIVNDLKSDVAMYAYFDSTNLTYCDMVDSVFTSFKSNNTNTGFIYYLARKLTMMGAFTPSINAKTYLQMTSTGAFRLIKNQKIADSIGLYYQLIKSYDNWSDLQRTRVNNMIAMNERVFDASVFLSVYKVINTNKDSLQKIINSNPPLLSTNKADMNAVLMQYQYFYGFMKLMNGRNAIASEQAKKLIALLEKEYSFENE